MISLSDQAVEATLLLIVVLLLTELLVWLIDELLDSHADVKNDYSARDTITFFNHIGVRTCLFWSFGHDEIVRTGCILYMAALICRFWHRHIHDVVTDIVHDLITETSLSLLERWKPGPKGEPIWFRYSGTQNMGAEGRFIYRDYFNKGNLIIRRNRDILREAIDKDYDVSSYIMLDVYEELCREERCIRAKISSICLFDTKWADQSGFFIRYRLTSTELHDGATHYFAKDLNGHFDECRKKTWRWFHLEEDEFLTGLRIRRTDKILCGITFITSKKREFGSADEIWWTMLFHRRSEGILYDTMVANPPGMHIVAFCLTFSPDSYTHIYFEKSKQCDHIGFYAKRIDWGIRVSFLLVRELVSRERATIVPAEDCDEQSQLVQRIVLLDDDLFRYVLGFVRNYDLSMD